MRISSKGRYGLAAMISVAQLGSTGDFVTVISIAEKLGISKIYLEQVFSLLKRSKLVTSIKGSQGGYQLSKSADKITILEILQAVEISLFEKTERSVSDSAMEIENVLKNLVWGGLDNAVISSLQKVTLGDLVSEADKVKNSEDFMFYI
ncbi:HTH-type transcriptional regulator IscR [Ruminiclostridium hungatei]|uniref:HTH-type transcriptional regulator IscR n=1 Tax=Ruminiclostridium hungatei TaxID=48256 RepID=A0A1V4SKF1_RUMHU|nr:Rrf2 family transcriptional regulator [Ruminiclostridium hungatei]OPX44330.1 HTH-type transcriptional regulator IscR [Ruminiclostridium hungatei]